MTKDELKKKAEMMIRTAVGRDEIDDFAQDVIEYLESQPQVVRCKDCKWRYFLESGKYMCRMLVNGWHNPDWFCADGKPKDT